MSKIAQSGHTDDRPLFGAIKRDINFHLHIHFSSRPKLHPTKFLQRYLFGDQSLDMKPISKITSLLREKFHENFARFASGAVQSFGTKMVWPWSSLVEGDEQTWHKCRTRMLCICWILFWYCLKHNSLPLGPIQPSSHSNKELMVWLFKHRSLEWKPETKIFSAKIHSTLFWMLKTFQLISAVKTNIVQFYAHIFLYRIGPWFSGYERRRSYLEAVSSDPGAW